MAKFQKRQFTQITRFVRNIKTWQLIGLLLICLVLAASLLRLNNLGMVERREAVKAADEAGDSQKLKESLVELQHYVSSHMNSSLGPNGVALEHSYNRAVEEWAKENANQTNPASRVYQEASVECRSRWQGNVESFRNDYVRCVADRVAALGSTEEEVADKPRADAYQINFVSPLWSLDLAGFAVLFCLLITGVIIIKFLEFILFRFLLYNYVK